MCRIFGQLGQIPVTEAALRQTAIAMKHGGPDRQSYETGTGWALGNNRLAIQGIDGGDQPFINRNGLYAVLNGEIYNHNQLRAQLVQQGFSFPDTCDGNVILPLFEIYGPEFVKQLDGMFALAIIDARRQPKLHIFSDPAGMKSVYLHIDRKTGTLSFASEIEGLALLTQKRLSIEQDTIFDYLSLRAICGETTIFKDIKTLGPARHLYFEMGKPPVITTYNSHIKSPKPNLTLADAGQQFRKILDEELQQIISADVPVCVVTSGGLDSTIISALVAKKIERLHSFHVCYKGNWPHDERTFAREAAQQFGTIHHEIEINPDDFPDIILKMTRHIGQPNTAPHSLSTYSLFQGIHNAGFRVAITGEGSDELFAGYERFNVALKKEDSWIPQYMDRFGPFPALLRNKILSTDFLNAAQNTPRRVEEFSNRISKTAPGIERLDTLQALDQWERFPYYILRRVDHLSMAHAVEVRIPFCQPRILDYARQLPLEHRLSDGKSKRVVYESARGLIPESIMTRKKQPFTLPVVAMIQKETALYEFMSSIFSDRSFQERGYFNSSAILENLNQQAQNPREDIANMLWSVMAFELWQRRVDEINSGIINENEIKLRPLDCEL